MLAQDRGDYLEAERRYTQSLHIKEQLANQAGIAITLSQRGNLAMAKNELATAVGFHISALAIRLQLEVPQAGKNIHALAELRRQLGVETFDGQAAKLIDAADVEELNQLLDEAEADR